MCPRRGDKPKGQKTILSLSWALFRFVSSSPPTPCLFIASCQACPDNNGVFKRIKRDPEVYSEHILENNELKQNCFAHFFLGSLDPHEHKLHERVVSKPSRNRSFPFLLPSFLPSFLPLLFLPPFLNSLGVFFILCSKVQRNVSI